MKHKEIQLKFFGDFLVFHMEEEWLHENLS